MEIKNKNELLEILGQLPQAKILVVGDIMLDRYWIGQASRISPEAPVPVVALQKVSNIPGGAANVAANISGFGASVFLVGVIGQDEAADCVRDALKNCDIDSNLLISSESRQTTTKTRVVVNNQQIARIDNEISTPLDKSDEEKLISQVLEIVSKTDLIVLSDYAKGSLTENLISKVVSEAKKYDKPILVDPKTRNFAKYNGTTMLTPNKKEAMIAADLEFDDNISLEAGVEKIFSEAEIESLLITLGENGMKLFQRNEKPIHFPSMARQVFDVTGAGDTVIAMLAVTLGIKADIYSAITLANIAAGLAVEKVGTSTVLLEDIRVLLQDHFPNTT